MHPILMQILTLGIQSRRERSSCCLLRGSTQERMAVVEVVGRSGWRYRGEKRCPEEKGR